MRIPAKNPEPGSGVRGVRVVAWEWSIASRRRLGPVRGALHSRVGRPSKAIPRRPRRPGKHEGPIPHTAREAAFERIADHADRFPDLLPAEPRVDRLDARDAALARALYETTVRRWRTLAFLLDTRLRRPLTQLEPGLQASLLVGAAQLLLMDRIPDHAAIHESVEWTKRAVRPGAAKLANAVLRGVTRLRGERAPDLTSLAALDRRDAIPLSDGRCVLLTEPIWPEDPFERAALATGLPQWLVTRWRDQFGPERTFELCLHTLVVAPVIVNASHATNPLGVIADWPPHDQPGFRLVPPETDLRAALEGGADLWVQDPGSASSIASLRDRQASLIIDVCAGQGTKTRQLSHLFPDSTIVASDLDAARLQTLQSLATILPNVEVCEASELAYRYGAKADLVVLDVPCTNTGVLARRVEARHRCSDRQLERLVATQRQIIADSIRLLAPAARLLYVTCSLEAEEVAAQGAWTTRWHSLAPIDEQVLLPAGLPGGDPASYRDGASWILLGGSAGRRPPR